MDGKKGPGKPGGHSSQPPDHHAGAGRGRGHAGKSTTVTPGGHKPNQEEAHPSPASKGRGKPGNQPGASDGRRASVTRHDPHSSDMDLKVDDASLLKAVHLQKQQLLYNAYMSSSSNLLQGSQQRLRRDSLTHHGETKPLQGKGSVTRNLMDKTSQAIVKKEKEPEHHFYRTPASGSMHKVKPVDTPEKESKGMKREDVKEISSSVYLDTPAGVAERPSATHHDLPLGYIPVPSPSEQLSDVLSKEGVLTSQHNIADQSSQQSQPKKDTTSQEPTGLTVIDLDSSPIPSPRSANSLQDVASGRRSVAQSLTERINTAGAGGDWGRVGRGQDPGGRQRLPVIGPSIGPYPTDSTIDRIHQERKDKKRHGCRERMDQLKSWWRRKRCKMQKVPVFRSNIRKVEGRFGSGLAAFFLFVRHLLLLDVALTILWFAFVVIPQAVHLDYQPVSDDFYFRNLFDGQNGLSKSWWFYGSYDQEVGDGYPLGLVYLGATILTYFGGLFVVFRSMAQALQEEGGAALQDTRYTFSHYVFTSWDYGLTAPEAVTNLRLSIASLFKDHMSEIKAKEQCGPQTRGQWCALVARRATAWVITVILIGLGCAAIVFATSTNFIADALEDMGYPVVNKEKNVLVVFGPTVIFMVVNYVIPFCVYKLPKMEKYQHPRTELHVSIGRVFVLHMANLLSLVVSTYTSVGKTKTGCPGTLIGQELYKLVILDTIAGVVSALVPSLVYFYWTKKKREFQMARSVLTVIERQALIWLGTLVCPVMPIVGVLTMMSLFLTYYVVVTVTCRPPSRRWNQSRRNSFLMGITVTTLVILLVPVSIAITRVDVINLGQMGDTGASCGPFGNQSMTRLAVTYTESGGTWLADLLDILLSATVLLPAILLMLAIIYFQTMRVTWEKRRKNLLAAEVLNERHENMELSKRLYGLLTY